MAGKRSVGQMYTYFPSVHSQRVAGNADRRVSVLVECRPASSVRGGNLGGLADLGKNNHGLGELETRLHDFDRAASRVDDHCVSVDFEKSLVVAVSRVDYCHAVILEYDPIPPVVVRILREN